MVRERCSSETATLPHIVTGRAAGREGGDRGDLPSFVSLCFLILACWLLTAKYYSGPLIE